MLVICVINVIEEMYTTGVEFENSYSIQNYNRVTSELMNNGKTSTSLLHCYGIRSRYNSLNYGEVIYSLG